MSLHEFVFLLPLSVEQYILGSRHLRVQEHLQEDVDILRNDPYKDIPLMPEGRFSEGTYSHRLVPVKHSVPKFLKDGEKHLILEERTWNAEVYSKTVIQPRGTLHDYATIQLFYQLQNDDCSDAENIFELIPKNLEKREVVHIDIADREEPSGLLEDLKLKEGWIQDSKMKKSPTMTAHYLVSIDTESTPRLLKSPLKKYLGKFIRRRLVKSHRKLIITMDEWKNLTEDQICELEQKCAAE